MRRQVKPRPLPAAEVVHRFLEQRARHVEMQAVERALQIGNPLAIEIVNRDRARAVRHERRAAAVEPQILFAERAQLQHDEIRILQLIGRGGPLLRRSDFSRTMLTCPFGSACATTVCLTSAGMKSEEALSA